MEKELETAYQRVLDDKGFRFGHDSSTRNSPQWAIRNRKIFVIRMYERLTNIFLMPEGIRMIVPAD